MVSSRGMLVKRDSTSKLDMNNPESCSITSLANSKIFLKVNLLVVIGSKIGTKCLAILKDQVLMADKMDQRKEQLSIKLLWILQRPYNMANLEPPGFSFLYSVFEITRESFNSLRRSVIYFSVLIKTFKCFFFSDINFRKLAAIRQNSSHFL